MPDAHNHSTKFSMVHAPTCLCLGTLLACSIASCLLEDTGTVTVPATSDVTSATSSSSSGNSNTSSSSSGNTTSSSSGQGGAGTGGGGQGGAGGTTAADTPHTCLDILALNPNAPSGIYTVDPDGIAGAAPFQVECKMMPPYGWTLVGLENASNSENLRFLGVEAGSPAALVAKGNALIGVRFKSLYTAVRIEWDAGSWVEFRTGISEIFQDTASVNLPLLDVQSSDSNFNSWTGNGVKFCRAASKSGNKLPGDSSWALKPTFDNNNQCGCNGMGWSGQGLFYSGTGTNCNPPCACHTGGLVGVKDDGEAKSGVVSWETRIYVL